MSKPRLICIAGPTAVGKTALTVRLAQELKTEVVSFDSRQFYREMSIGTAKPNEEEMQGVPHHFIHSHSIHEPLNAGSFAREAQKTIQNRFKSLDTLIFTGGSGLYMDAVLFGLDEFPSIPDEIRQSCNQLYEKEGLEAIQNQLKQLDPDYFATVDRSNHSRIIRALEVCLASGKPYSSFKNSRSKELPFDFEIHILDRPRHQLHERINRRVDLMMDAGLLEEVKGLLGQRDLPALQTVGYREFFDYFDGACSLEEAVAKVKTSSRRYAKRQLTWFRKYENARWWHPDEFTLNR